MADHWYDPEGNRAHVQPTKDGSRTRNTNIRDARKLGLFPSVTSITAILPKPQLERWAKEQVAKAAFGQRPAQGETEDLYAKRILNLAYRPTEDAADFGTRVHAAIEGHFDGVAVPDDLLGYVQPALDWKERKNLEFIEREKIIVSAEYGFAGQLDIAAKSPKGGKLICDWKTRKSHPDYPMKPYDNQVLQISAYAIGYFGLDAVKAGEVHGCNCFISSTEKGRFEVAGYKPEELLEAWDTFLAICELWRRLKNYDPRVN